MVGCAKVILFSVISIKFQKKCTILHHFFVFVNGKVTIWKEFLRFRLDLRLHKCSLAIGHE